jgi:LEA14-like dessication related protein
MRNLFLIGAAAYAIFYFNRVRNFRNTVKVNFLTLKTSKASGLNLPTIELVFQIQNITGLPVTIRGISGDFFINDRYIANLSKLEPINVAPFSETTFAVKLNTNVFDVVNNIDLILKKQVGYTAKDNLNINVGNNIIPFTIERSF